MSTEMHTPPKPVTSHIRPEITRLPTLTPARRGFRWLLVTFVRLITWLLVRVEVCGQEHIPDAGPLLVVSNHLGDADVPVGLAISPLPVEIFAKADLYDYPLLGWVLRAYGVIWIHRGQPDRRAIRAGLDALNEGRVLGIAPEGRESVIGALEEGTSGAAYLAIKSGAAVLPMTFTGTENKRVFGGLRRFQRARVRVQFGPTFQIVDDNDNWRSAVERGTERIMQTLAAQLPPEYRGVYNDGGPV